MSDVKLVLRCIVPAVLAFAGACSGPGEPVPQEGAPGKEVVARVGDRAFTLEEIDAVAMTADIGSFQGVYDARRRALDKVIADELLRREAAARGVSEEQLLKDEVPKRIKPVTDDEVRAFYDQNQARLGNPPPTFEQISGQIRQFLSNQSATRAQQSYLVELKNKAELRVTLEPPRVKVLLAANDPARGPADAKVTVVEYSDFQ